MSHHLTFTRRSPALLLAAVPLLFACTGTVDKGQPASSLAVSSSVAASVVSSVASEPASASSAAMAAASLLTSNGLFNAGQQDFVAFAESASVSFDGEFSVAIAQVSANPWDVQLMHPVAIEAGKEYTLCYHAKADAKRDISVNVDDAAPDYASLSGGAIQQSLSTQYQAFSHSFFADATDATARLTFNLGASAIGVQLDNISLALGESCALVSSSSASSVPSELASCELVPPAVAPASPVGLNLNRPKTEPMIPKWGLGFMQSQWGYGSAEAPFGYDTQEGFLNHARALRGLDNPYGDHTHPADIMVLDMYWCGGTVGDFSCWDWPNNMRWDHAKFPDPKAMMDELHAMNFKVIMNYHAGGFESHNQEWMAAMQSHLDAGLDAPWLDFWSGGSKAETQIWNKMRSHFGEDKRLMFMARHYTLPNTENAEGGEFNAAGVYQDGIGKETPPNEDDIEKTMPVHWTGDVVGSWLGLEQSIEGVVYGPDGAMGGWSYLHTDTPGHSGVVGPQSTELALRWIQFSDFTTGTRNHGWTPRDVWSWGEMAEEYSYFSRMLRYRLLPYIYTYTNVIWEQAIPLTRPMKLAYPGQADHLKFQYMFGDELLVAPVYKSAADFGGAMDVFLPAGEQWVDYWNHKVYNGNQTVKADVRVENLKHVPLFVKRGSIIPMGPEILYIDTAVHPDPLTLDIYPKCAGESRFTLHDDDGESLGYQRGEYARTEFAVEKFADNLRVDVGPSVGEYSGKPKQQNYLLKINLIDEAYRKVKHNNTELTYVNDFNALLEPQAVAGTWALDAARKILYVRFSTEVSQTNTVVIEK